MQVSVEITSSLGRRLTIGVPAARVETEVAARLEKAARSANLKGFRPGKVPVNVLRQRFGAGIRQEVLGEVMSQSFYEALRQEDLKPAGQPLIEPRAVASGKDLEFTATFEVYPEIDLIDFRKLAIERPVASVTEDDVNRMIEILRNQQATWESVDRAAADGDKVNVDYTGRKDGEEFEGGSASGSELQLGSNRMIPGFETGIVGMNAGETRELQLEFPAEYHAEALRGAAVVFTVTLNGVTEKRMPELDEEFFTRYGVSEGGVDGFRTEVRANMERELKQALRNKTKARALDALLARSDVEVPRSLVDAEIANLRRQTIQQFGGDAARFSADVLPDSLFSARAEKRVSLGLVLAEIIRKEGVKANPERVKAMIEEIASTYEDPEAVVRWYYDRNNRELLGSVEAAVLEDQVVEIILDRASVADAGCSYEDALRPDPVEEKA